MSQLINGTDNRSNIGTKQIRMRLTLAEIKMIARALETYQGNVEPYGLTRRFLCAAGGWYSR